MDSFHEAMRRHDLVALWERVEARANSDVTSEPAFHWRWSDIEPLIDQAIEAADMSVAERRVIQLKHPAFPSDYVAVTTNVNFGFQVLAPGEKARPHRHNMNALRFVMEGDGAVTTVNGKRCEMTAGDLILTPAMTWHEHEHHGDKGRVVWLDALDAPLVRHLRCVHFQPGPVRDQPTLPPDSAFAHSGLMPVQSVPDDCSPVFRYPLADAAAALAATPAEPDGLKRVRYVNPATGGAVMSLMDCYLVGLPPGVETSPRRSTANSAFLVADGEGVSTVGEKTVRWEKYDVFTMPAWQWTSHKAGPGGAKLFQVTDREVLRRLNLLREESKA